MKRQSSEVNIIEEPEENIDKTLFSINDSKIKNRVSVENKFIDLQQSLNRSVKSRKT